MKTKSNPETKIEFTKKVLDNNKGGGGISIAIPGFAGNPEAPDDGQVFIEYYEGKIRVHVWNGESDPTTTELKPVREVFYCPDCGWECFDPEAFEQECGQSDCNGGLTETRMEPYDE